MLFLEGMITLETLGVGAATTRPWPSHGPPSFYGETVVRIDEVGKHVRVLWRAYVYKNAYFMEMTLPLYAKMTTQPSDNDPALKLAFERTLQRCALALSTLELAAASDPMATQDQIDAFLFDYLASEKSLRVALTANALDLPRPTLVLTERVPAFSAFASRDPAPDLVERVKQRAMPLLRLVEARGDFLMTEVLQYMASLRDHPTLDHELVHMALVKAWITHPAARRMMTDLIPALQATLRRNRDDVWKSLHHSTLDAIPMWIPENYNVDTELVQSLTNLEFVLRTFYALVHSSSIWPQLIGTSGDLNLGVLEMIDLPSGVNSILIHDGLNRAVGSRLGVSDAIYLRMANVIDRWVCKAHQHPILVPAGITYYALTPAVASFVQWGIWANPRNVRGDFAAFVDQGFGTSLYDMTRHVAQTIPILKPVAQARSWIDPERGFIHPNLVKYVQRHIAVCMHARPDLLLGKDNLSRGSLHVGWISSRRNPYFISSNGLRIESVGSAMRRSERAQVSDVDWACQWSACLPYIPDKNVDEHRRALSTLPGELDKWKGVVMAALAKMAQSNRISSVLEYMVLQTTHRAVFASNRSWDPLFQLSQRCEMINVPTQHQLDWIAKTILSKSRTLAPFPSQEAAACLPSHEAMVRFAAVVAWDRFTLKNRLTLESLTSDVDRWSRSALTGDAPAPPSFVLLCDAASASRPSWMSALPHTVYVIERRDRPFEKNTISRSVMAFQHLAGAMACVAQLQSPDYIIVRYDMQGNAWMCLDAIDALAETTRRSMSGEICIPRAERVDARRDLITNQLSLSNPNHPDMALQSLTVFPAMDDISGSLWKGGSTAGWIDTQTVRSVSVYDGGLLRASYV